MKLDSMLEDIYFFCKFIILHDFGRNRALKMCDTYMATTVSLEVRIGELPKKKIVTAD
jgi:hypothetical protein